MNSWSQVLDAVTDQYRKIGTSVSEGIELICAVPTLAPEAFVHRLPGPATPDQIALVRRKLPAVPDEYIELLETCNGCSLYCDRLALYGVQPRLLNRRTSKFIPYSVVMAQVPEEGFAAGSVGPKRDRLLIGRDGMVRRVPRGASDAVGEWRSLKDCVLAISRDLTNERDWSRFTRDSQGGGMA